MDPFQTQDWSIGPAVGSGQSMSHQILVSEQFDGNNCLPQQTDHIYKRKNFCSDLMVSSNNPQNRDWEGQSVHVNSHRRQVPDRPDFWTDSIWENKVLTLWNQKDQGPNRLDILSWIKSGVNEWSLTFTFWSGVLRHVTRWTFYWRWEVWLS